MNAERIKYIAVAVFFFVAGVLAVYYLFSTPDYSYQTNIAGVSIKSDIPFSEVTLWRYINLRDSADRDILTCNFELSAISLPDRQGHVIDVRKADSTGVYIKGDSVLIEGDSSHSLLNACHAFACLRDNISCPDDLDIIYRASGQWKRVNVLLDSRLGVDAVSGYGDVLGALGYLQAATAQAKDLDNDGVITPEEMRESMEQNMLLIFPYSMNGSKCVSQPFSSALQQVNKTGELFDCSELTPSIRFNSSESNKITFDGGNIIIEGDDIHVHTGAILVRDIIAPDFISKLYGI
ncbi:MAG: hypothetical protein B6U97_00390 [Candidatus Altiarchaeales archaeon ex4484_96]|nr:MAG: hypothetical protein B6U97_00390 [Candidatus Altiarchaeales archaeon ex4484_96]